MVNRRMKFILPDDYLPHPPGLSRGVCGVIAILAGSGVVWLVLRSAFAGVW